MNSFPKSKINAAVPSFIITEQSDSLMRVRISLKLLLLLITAVSIITILSYWNKCNISAEWPRQIPQVSEPCGTPKHIDPFQEESLLPSDQIECFINDEEVISCRHEDGEVYVPFSFLKRHFEIYGKIVKKDGVERFDWQHSYSKVYYPKHKYDPSDAFLWFENYNVEVRDRVKCISATEGVPVSTQWDVRGHFYPIQIAQFGLSHFSKNLTDAAPSVVTFEDGEKTCHGKWLHSRLTKTALRKVHDSAARSTVLEFNTGEDKEILSIEEDIEEVNINCDLKLISNASLIVSLSSNSGEHILYKIHYIMSDMLLSSTDFDIYYGIGTSVAWKTITRDLITDLIKGLSSLKSKIKFSKPKNLRVRSIMLQGFGRIDNISLSSSAHMAHFFAAANWLVNHQDRNGGWPNMVTRKLSNGMLELAPGWYSAMAQGQAMSLLTRAFKVTGDLQYLESALQAIKLFNIRSEHRGILTYFLGRYVWYEEYPTIPSSYVLNGFIYSLFGLYDVQQSCTHRLCREAEKLFENGLVSLKHMLPLFDTGSGSVYDLRHFSLGVAPNLARWDYHSTHINQLLFLITIHNDPILKSITDRWIGYMKGKKAPHN